jgi:hypothetical protein
VKQQIFLAHDYVRGVTEVLFSFFSGSEDRKYKPEKIMKLGKVKGWKMRMDDVWKKYGVFSRTERRSHVRRREAKRICCKAADWALSIQGDKSSSFNQTHWLAWPRRVMRLRRIQYPLGSPQAGPSPKQRTRFSNFFLPLSLPLSDFA